MSWYNKSALTRYEKQNLLGVMRYIKPYRWGLGEAYSMHVISVSQFINSKNAISCFHSGQLQVTVENSLPDSRLSPSATCILPASAKAALQQTPRSISNFPFLHITVPLGFPFQTSSTVLPRKYIMLCYQQVGTRNS